MCSFPVLLVVFPLYIYFHQPSSISSCFFERSAEVVPGTLTGIEVNHEPLFCHHSSSSAVCIRDTSEILCWLHHQSSFDGFRQHPQYRMGFHQPPQPHLFLAKLQGLHSWRLHLFQLLNHPQGIKPGYLRTSTSHADLHLSINGVA